MDDSNDGSTQATFAGGGKLTSHRVAGGDLGFRQLPETTAANAVGHDLPVTDAFGCF
jgi:hypothetical protein